MASAEPNTRYVPVFVEGDEQYVYVQELGVGFQAQAQLVQHVQSGDYLVRKISKIGETAQEIAEESLGKNEIDTLNFLQNVEHEQFQEWFQTVYLPELLPAAEHQYRAKTAAQLAGQPWEGILFPVDEESSVVPDQDVIEHLREFMVSDIMPEANRHTEQDAREEAGAQGYSASHSIVTLHSSSNLALPTDSKSDPEDAEFMLVIYLSYCNGGDLNRLGKYTKNSNTPASIVLRYLAEISHALQFMYQNGIVHADLGDRNIFINFSSETNEPHFFLGDFGMAHDINQDDSGASGSDAPRYYNVDRRYLLTKLTVLQLQNFIDNATVELLVRELTRLADNDSGLTGLPDLTVFLILLTQAVVDFPVTRDDISRIPGPLEVTPVYFDSVEACAAARIVGTFRIGTVTLDSAGALESAQSISEGIYYPEYFTVD